MPVRRGRLTNGWLVKHEALRGTNFLTRLYLGLEGALTAKAWLNDAVHKTACRCP